MGNRHFGRWQRRHAQALACAADDHAGAARAATLLALHLWRQGRTDDTVQTGRAALAAVDTYGRPEGSASALMQRVRPDGHQIERDSHDTDARLALEAVARATELAGDQAHRRMYCHGIERTSGSRPLTAAGHTA